MFKYCFNKLRNANVPLNRIFSIHICHVIISRIFLDKRTSDGVNHSDHIENSLKFIDTLIEVGLFKKSENYHLDEVITEICNIIKTSYFQNDLCNQANATVLFKLLDMIPEFKNIYNEITIDRIPFRLEFVKNAYKHGLDINCIYLTKKIYSYIPYHNEFDVLPPPNILAFLYSKGRNPEIDISRLNVNIENLVQTFKCNTHSDFKSYINEFVNVNINNNNNNYTLNYNNNSNKFNLRYDETTIPSINTILDFGRMYQIFPNPEITRLSRGIMKEKYELEYISYTEEESNEVFDSLDDIFPKCIIEMILSK
jgi:hypothetical protein